MLMGYGQWTLDTQTLGLLDSGYTSAIEALDIQWAVIYLPDLSRESYGVECHQEGAFPFPFSTFLLSIKTDDNRTKEPDADSRKSEIIINKGGWGGVCNPTYRHQGQQGHQGHQGQ
jgi:hypothetical protein